MRTTIERDQTVNTILMNIENLWFFSNRLRGESHPRSKLTSEQVYKSENYINDYLCLQKL